MNSFNPRLIFLVGFMGAGKTHIGELLASKMGMPFFDLDTFIEGKSNLSVTEYFEKHGEEGFRILERKCLRDFSVMGNAVLATGGGTPCFFDNAEWMNAHGVTIYLKADVELLVRRLATEKEHRPLIAHLDTIELMSFIEEKLKERSPFYEKATVHVDQTMDDVEIVKEIFKNFSNITGH